MSVKSMASSPKDYVCITEKGGDAEPKVPTITGDYL